MPTTFDGPNLRIILDSPTGGVLNVNVQRNLYSEWKEWVLQSDNSKYLPAFRTVGGDGLTPGVEAGAYFFMFNDLGWRIISSDEDQTINYNGNLVAEDASLPLIVPTPGRTVLHLGLQPVTQRVDEILSLSEDAAFNGKVTIDVDNGRAGTAYPIGTPFDPVNNIADAFLIASSLGVRSYDILGVISLDRDYDRWKFLGSAAERATTINLNGFNTDKSRFENLLLTGAMIGTMEAENCGLDLFSSIAGVFRSCGFVSDFSIQPMSNAVFVDCFSEIAGADAPNCDLNGANSVSFRNYSGGIDLLNCQVGTTVSVDLDPGTCNLDSSNIGGTVRVRGTGVLNDNSNGTLVLNDSLVKADELDQLFFDRKVHYDETRGSTGTPFPAGTPGSPSNNPSDLRTIADNQGFRSYQVLGNLTLDQVHQEWEFNGSGGSTARVNLNGQDVSGSKFQGINVQGNMDAESSIVEIRNGPAGNLSGLRGTLVECGVFGTISFGTTANNHRFVRCQQGNVAPTFDCTNLGTGQIIFALWDGQMTITNLTSGNIIIDSLGADVILDSSCTGGTITLRGLVRLVDNSGLVNIVRNTMMDADEIQIIQAAIAGNAEVALNDLSIEIKDKSGSTLRTLSVSADGRIRNIL